MISSPISRPSGPAEAPVLGSPGLAQATALFAAAHRRRRRRRAFAVLAALALVGSVLGGLAAWPHHAASRSASREEPGAEAVGRTAAFTLPAAAVAWVDYSGGLHLGDVATQAQRVLAMVPAATGTQPAASGLRLDRSRVLTGGTELAAWARAASLSSPCCANTSELAIINASTGAVRLIPAARLVTTEDAGWILWLPGGQRLLAGALSDSYAVDASSYAARPFFFFPQAGDGLNVDHDIMDTPDISFSAVLVPAIAPQAAATPSPRTPRA